MKAIILAAGFGTRLYPLTQNQPKALLMLGGKTILDYLVEKLDYFPFIDEIILVTSGRFYLDFEAWKTQTSYRKSIRIVHNDIYKPEDRFGAVRDMDLALKSFCGTPENFLIFCGDNYFDFPLGYFLLPCLGHPKSSFIGLYDVGDKSAASQYGVADTDLHGRIIRFEEKPANPSTTKVSIGVYYLTAPVRLKLYEYLEIEKRNPDKIGDFIGWLTAKEPVYGVDFDGAWFDIGSMESYEAARRHIGYANAQ